MTLYRLKVEGHEIVGGRCTGVRDVVVNSEDEIFFGARNAEDIKKMYDDSSIELGGPVREHVLEAEVVEVSNN